ncbi:hypothetical protein [Halalkalibacter urbisdiaboli]|uniref:hypothetical protein n=1 Tax=Halalkalibacter urbisdiaboli TaxID=1960589 RepID=UPI001FD921CE|nr:hypothetical protein [Halalkalibacter urbisdiaboli]
MKILLYIISYGFHLVSSFIFFLLIPLPFLIKGTMGESGRFILLLRVYKRMMWLAHGALILALVSGILMLTSWFSIWLLTVMGIWLAIGALLGLTAKMCRLTLERIEIKEGAETEITKLRHFSLLLSLAIIVMFAIKFLRYV